ncbi:mediator of RNA polymerase II transcription subunit 17 isoform X1 [Typha angustifolia]|uniref:mediator of RNA polymerase II transcription subunit 17 isoform X1 n=2 Tax=Typha angustifolia TaxID=59011 RepID=UPI003C2E761B
MQGSMRIDLDKLPIKRLDAIDELGNEQFPPYSLNSLRSTVLSISFDFAFLRIGLSDLICFGYFCSDTSNEEQRLTMIRRIDFSSVVEKDAKKAKTNSKEAAQTWPWQSLVENLQVAHQELSVIIDLINTVEANDAVAVAGMQRPKQLPNEALADLAVSAATKLQRLRHLGRYFKQSSRAMEQQVSRGARFYGSLIRLQQNWKVKRQRLVAIGPGSEGFTFDLLDNTLSDLTAVSRSSTMSTVRIDHDSAGILAIQIPQKSCHSLCLKFLGADSNFKSSNLSKKNACGLGEVSRATKKEALTDEDVNECVKNTHSILREIHQSIFEEQVFDMVNRETYSSAQGINVTGMREDFLQLAIGQENSLCICLMPSGKEDDPQMIQGNIYDEESIFSNSKLAVVEEKHDSCKKNLLGVPNPVGLEIYLLYIFHNDVLTRAKERHHSQAPGQPAGGGYGLLSHFCLTVSHRTFSNKVLSELECLVSRVPYLQLLTHPTWHSRTSSWSLCLKVPQPVLHAGRLTKLSDNQDVKYKIRSQFYTKIVLKDDQINVSGEAAPSIIGSFTGTASDLSLINSYGCDLEDLPMILLQQVASQVIHWLHEEASVIGMNASRDFLCLYFDLDQGDTLGLVAHVDPEDVHGCISWWVVMDDRSLEEGKLSTDNSESENRKFLGYLSLEALYSTLMDLVSLCSAGDNH